MNSLGISLKWDVYDWGYKRHLMDEKQINIEQSQLNLTETQSQVVIDLDSRFRKLREARSGLKVAQLGEDAEKPLLCRSLWSSTSRKLHCSARYKRNKRTWRRQSRSINKRYQHFGALVRNLRSRARTRCGDNQPTEAAWRQFISYESRAPLSGANPRRNRRRRPPFQ